jgi:hypothetical protein
MRSLYLREADYEMASGNRYHNGWNNCDIMIMGILGINKKW